MSKLGDQDGPQEGGPDGYGQGDQGGFEQGDQQGGDQGYEDQGEAGEYDEGRDYVGGGDGGGSDPDTSDSEGEDAPDFLDAEHPLMSRVQKAILTQLTSADERMTLELREREAEVRTIKTKREQIGVELYQFQQGLAKLQMQLEKTHDRYNVFFQLRRKAEENLKRQNSLYVAKLEERGVLEKRRTKTQKELDKLKITVKQIDEFNEKVKSEILVTRRAAYGTEQSMQKLEKSKRRQDELVDSLNEQLRGANEQLSVYEAQLEAQAAETSIARKTLEEAVHEMDLIQVEKREYLQKWKSSLIGMANRDAALQAAEAALMEEREKLRNLEMEIKGYRASVRDEQASNERMTQRLARVEAEIKFTETQLVACTEQRKALNEKYSRLRATLERTDRELARAETEQKEIKKDIATIHKHNERLVQDKQQLDDRIMENLSNQTTIEKGAQNVWKITQKLKLTIHEKEIKMGEIQNEVARIKVDALNTGAHNKELRQTLDAYDNELLEKDKLIEKYELEIRQRHDKIEKKQIYIARLNRKYEVLTSKQEDENTGPLEATIKNLRKEIETTNKGSAELQREWIKTQTELVALVSQTNNEQEQLQELASRQTILTQKKIRLNNLYASHLGEVKELRKMIKAMHTDMAKLNDLISKNTSLQGELANNTYTMEAEFMAKLKGLELASVQTDAQIAQLKDEKETVFQEIVEVEKQVMLWEKKILLERETQEALDPQYGQPEIKGMEKEIHRMKLRLQQLQRAQEKMIVEMERTIEKKEHIKLNHQTTRKGDKAPGQGAHYTQASLNKKILQLKGTLKENVQGSKRVMAEIAKQEDQNTALLAELEGQQDIYSATEDRRATITENINDVYFSKQVNLERMLMLRKRTQRYQEAVEQSTELPEHRTLQEDLVRADDKFIRIRDAITKLQADNPKHAGALRRLLSFA